MGLFSAIKKGLSKTRDALMGELKGIVGAGKITDDTLEELEEHLIKADVGVEAAFLLTDALRENALGKSLTTEQVLDIMRSEAERLLKDPPPFELKGKPHVVLVIGVNGAGKTTTIGKLAARLMGEGKKVMIAACDTFRAAAIDQLQTWAERSGAEFVKHEEGSDPAAVAYDACQAAVARGCDVVLIDTAGRLHNKDYLMEELRKIPRDEKGESRFPAGYVACHRWQHRTEHHQPDENFQPELPANRSHCDKAGWHRSWWFCSFHSKFLANSYSLGWHGGTHRPACRVQQT